jgi:hypothetical protein
MTHEEIKEKLKEAKDEQNMSFRIMEEKSGYSAQELCRYFKPTHNTRIDVLSDLCDVLGLELVVRKKPHMMEGKKRLYECDPDKNFTCAKYECHRYGGQCHLTSVEDYSA